LKIATTASAFAATVDLFTLIYYTFDRHTKDRSCGNT